MKSLIWQMNENMRISKIEKLQGLLDCGVITKKEYNQKVCQINNNTNKHLK